jgi:hypothetical protein
MLVWALTFGLPHVTFTDNNGNYRIPWSFVGGTIMGTMARNSDVTVKPLNTTGTFLNNIAQLYSTFILGSTHLEGWKNACQMKNDININFNNHDERRYWAQILHIVRLHNQFCAQDAIPPAPWGLIWYAKWGNQRGSFGAPMLSHITNSPATLITKLFTWLFDTNLTINAPNFSSLMSGLLPSIITQEAPNANDDGHYSERFMQWSFHELGHASFFKQVGSVYWLQVITNILETHVSGSPCDSYGCGTEVYAGNTQLNEAWAEFIGKTHHSRIHPNGQCRSTIIRNAWLNYPAALESEPSFFQRWIPTGVFFDLADGINSNSEPDDVIQNITISQMYRTFSPNIHNFCEYRDQFVTSFPIDVTREQFNRVLTQNRFLNQCDE